MSINTILPIISKITGDDMIIKNYKSLLFYLDEQYESLEKFTALGSIYLIHNTVKNFKLYNFRTASFDIVQGNYLLDVDMIFI